MNQTELTLNRALENQVQKYPNKVFIYSQDTTFSYENVSDLVNRLATRLKKSGLQKGDSICILLPRTPELIITFLACTKLGILPAPVNYMLCATDVISFVTHLAPKAIISSAKLLSPELEVGFNGLNTLLRIDTDNSTKDNNWMTWEKAIDEKPYAGQETILSSDLAYLNFTTGTSGYPKGALTTHANIYWNTRSAVAAFSLDHKDIHLCMFASFSHPHELFSRALFTGASLVLLEEINPKTIIETINKHAVTCMMGLAPMYELMAKRCGSMNIPSLRIAESGGMFTRKIVNQNFSHHFGLPILSVWGSTETTGVTLANTTQVYKTDGTMGKACPFYEVKLLNEKKQHAIPGEIGELYFKGPGLVTGYLDKPSFLDKNGWFASGDIATVDEAGFYYFVERKSGMIKVAGLKVYPLQLELLLLEHPKILEIAVLGVSDPRKGCVPKAFVVTNDGCPISYSDLLEFCKGKIPSYMVPKHIELRESLPKIGSGKINKKLL